MKRIEVNFWPEWIDAIVCGVFNSYRLYLELLSGRENGDSAVEVVKGGQDR